MNFFHHENIFFRLLPYFFVALALLPNIAICQTAQTHKSAAVLSLAEAESIAIAQNLDVSLAMAQYRESAATYLSAWSSFLPTASTSASWRRSDRQTISFGTSDYFLSRDSYSLGLSVSLPLFSGGRDYIALRRAKLTRDASWLAYMDARSQAVSDVVSAYLALVQAVMEAQIAEQSLRRAVDEQKIVQQKYSLGSAADVETSKMRVQVAQKKLAKLQAENNVQRYREQLCILLNFPMDTTFKVDTLLAPPQSADLPDLNYYLNVAGNRSFQQAELSAHSAKLKKLSAWLSYMPKLSLSANWSWNGAEFPKSFSTFNDEGSFSYGLSLSWTLLSGTSRIGEIRGADAGLQKSLTTMNKTALTIEQEIRQAHRTMLEATVSYELSLAQIKDAELSLSATRERYELGSATLLELIDAELALEQAQLQKVMAISTFYQSKAKLLWLTGK